MNGSLKIVFMGTPDFAVPSLQALIDSPHELVAVVCQPTASAPGRGSARRRSDAGNRTQPAGAAPDTVRTEIFYPIAGSSPDLLVVVPTACSCRFACWKHHDSRDQCPWFDSAQVPWRGPDSVGGDHGETETGITIMQWTVAWTPATILLVDAPPSRSNETAGELFDGWPGWLGSPGTSLIAGWGQLTRQPQDHALATTAPMLNKEMGHIDWSRLPEAAEPDSRP
jgi:methionyl-tRNA formyltransferase